MTRDVPVESSATQGGPPGALAGPLATAAPGIGASAGPAPTLRDFVAQAALQLKAAGWRIARCRGGSDVAWHLVATQGERLRVVQVLAPATSSASRQQDKRRLGREAQLATKAGSMEQWLAHIRPGGRVTFGLDVLSGSMWGRAGTSEEVRDRLGLPAHDEPGPAASDLDRETPAPPASRLPLRS